jgi:hypothetical protein
MTNNLQPIRKTVRGHQQPRPDLRQLSNVAHSSLGGDLKLFPDNFQAASAQNRLLRPFIAEGDPGGLRLPLRPGTRGSVPSIRGIPIKTRQRNIENLRELARSLREKKVAGVDIWVALTRRAVDNNKNLSTPTRSQMDNVIQDLAIVTVGKEAFEYLKQYQNITHKLDSIARWSPQGYETDPMVDRFLDELKLLGADRTLAVEDLDTHRGADFKPEINDKSTGQIKHTYFYHFMSYVTHDAFAVTCGSLLHEARDDGSSAEDHYAGVLGIEMGKHMRAQRETSPNRTNLESWPALMGAAYGIRGVQYGLPENNRGMDFSQQAALVHDRAKEGLEDPTWGTSMQSELLIPLGRNLLWTIDKAKQFLERWT